MYWTCAVGAGNVKRKSYELLGNLLPFCVDGVRTGRVSSDGSLLHFRSLFELVAGVRETSEADSLLLFPIKYAGSNMTFVLILIQLRFS